MSPLNLGILLIVTISMSAANPDYYEIIDNANAVVASAKQLEAHLTSVFEDTAVCQAEVIHDLNEKVTNANNYIDSAKATLLEISTTIPPSAINATLLAALVSQCNSIVSNVLIPLEPINLVILLAIANSDITSVNLATQCIISSFDVAILATVVADNLCRADRCAGEEKGYVDAVCACNNVNSAKSQISDTAEQMSGLAALLSTVLSSAALTNEAVFELVLLAESGINSECINQYIYATATSLMMAYNTVIAADNCFQLLVVIFPNTISNPAITIANAVRTAAKLLLKSTEDIIRNVESVICSLNDKTKLASYTGYQMSLPNCDVANTTDTNIDVLLNMIAFAISIQASSTNALTLAHAWSTVLTYVSPTTIEDLTAAVDAAILATDCSKFETTELRTELSSKSKRPSFIIHHSKQVIDAGTAAIEAGTVVAQLIIWSSDTIDLTIANAAESVAIKAVVAAMNAVEVARAALKHANACIEDMEYAHTLNALIKSNIDLIVKAAGYIAFASGIDMIQTSIAVVDIISNSNIGSDVNINAIEQTFCDASIIIKSAKNAKKCAALAVQLGVPEMANRIAYISRPPLVVLIAAANAVINKYIENCNSPKGSRKKHSGSPSSKKKKKHSKSP